MEDRRRIPRFAYPFLLFMAMVFLVLAYFNLRIGRLPEGMVTLAASIMLVVMAVGALVCRSGVDARRRPPTPGQTSDEEGK
jgi:hypothetical protein